MKGTKGNLATYERRIRKLFAKNRIKGLSLIDYGYGAGIWPHAVEEDFQTLIGIDASTKVMKIAERYLPKAEFIKATVTQLPTHVKYDVVVSVSVSEFIEPELYDQYLLELIRITRSTVILHFYVESKIFRRKGMALHHVRGPSK
jgi:2-polyprenyl-3-methyl-5-hydroxy-6-metoxy-1,4-benzoquinol methylase